MTGIGKRREQKKPKIREKLVFGVLSPLILGEFWMLVRCLTYSPITQKQFLFFIGNVMETNLVEASFILEDKRLSVQVRKLSDRNRDHNIDNRKELTVEMATIGSPPHANTD